MFFRALVIFSPILFSFCASVLFCSSVYIVAFARFCFSAFLRFLFFWFSNFFSFSVLLPLWFWVFIFLCFFSSWFLPHRGAAYPQLSRFSQRKYQHQHYHFFKCKRLMSTMLQKNTHKNIPGQNELKRSLTQYEITQLYIFFLQPFFFFPQTVCLHPCLDSCWQVSPSARCIIGSANPGNDLTHGQVYFGIPKPSVIL